MSTTDPAIAEFLEYYALAILKEGPSDAAAITRAIEDRSKDNEKFRPGSCLSIPEESVADVLLSLERHERIARSPDSALHELTDEGNKALERIEAMKEEREQQKEQAADKLISLLAPPPPTKRVLDVGTGEGFLALKLVALGFDVLGIDTGEFDYSKTSIDQAREKATEADASVEFKQEDVTGLQGENLFDYVVASQSLHCMKDQAACLAAVHRLLRPGGKFVCMDFAVGLLGFLHHGFHSFLAPSRQDWERLPLNVGFVEVEIHELRDYCVVAGTKPE